MGRDGLSFGSVEKNYAAYLEPPDFKYYDGIQTFPPLLPTFLGHVEPVCSARRLTALHNSGPLLLDTVASHPRATTP